MELTVERDLLTKDSSIGKLSIDGEYECETLEDKFREVPGEEVALWKVPNETAIPIGKYRVLLTWSPRFQRVLPLLLNVPGYEGVRIHSGNTNEDTDGCILVGKQREADDITHSREALEALMTKLQAASQDLEEIWITVS